MLFRQKYDTFIRVYDQIGYIINTTTFSDCVTDESGAIFLKVLTREPQSIELICSKIALSYNDIRAN